MIYICMYTYIYMCNYVCVYVIMCVCLKKWQEPLPNHNCQEEKLC